MKMKKTLLVLLVLGTVIGCSSNQLGTRYEQASAIKKKHIVTEKTGAAILEIAEGVETEYDKAQYPNGVKTYTVTIKPAPGASFVEDEKNICGAFYYSKLLGFTSVNEKTLLTFDSFFAYANSDLPILECKVLKEEDDSVDLSATISTNEDLQVVEPEEPKEQSKEPVILVTPVEEEVDFKEVNSADLKVSSEESKALDETKEISVSDDAVVTEESLGNTVAIPLPIEEPL